MFSFGENLTSTSLYFQGGVRRAILIFLGICILLLVPVYFLGQLGATTWANLSLNPNKINEENIVKDKNLLDYGYEIARSQLVPLATGETVLYTTVNNKKNLQIGYSPFVYTIKILDNKGSVLEERREENYLLPGEVKYILAETKNPQATKLTVTTEPETKTVIFNPFGLNLAERVNIQIRNNTVTEKDNGQDLELKAFLKNGDLVDIQKLDLLYIIRDTRDRVVGIGKYQLEYLKSGEEKEFSLSYPKPKYRRAVRLDVRTFVNYLDTRNVQLPEIIEPNQEIEES